MTQKRGTKNEVKIHKENRFSTPMEEWSKANPNASDDFRYSTKNNLIVHLLTESPHHKYGLSDVT